MTAPTVRVEGYSCKTQAASTVEIGRINSYTVANGTIICIYLSYPKEGIIEL
jgi:hypothetical protein